jgi:hypothetical protein
MSPFSCAFASSTQLSSQYYREDSRIATIQMIRNFKLPPGFHTIPTKVKNSSSKHCLYYFSKYHQYYSLRFIFINNFQDSNKLDRTTIFTELVQLQGNCAQFPAILSNLSAAVPM